MKHPQSILANTARESDTKKVMATKLKGFDLAEAWRIKQLQTQRAERKPDYRCEPRLRNEWELQGLKPVPNAKYLIWPRVNDFRYSFESKIAERIQSKWAYGKYRWHSYTVSVTHSSEVGTVDRHAGSGCIDYPVTFKFDLLRQEAVWIGGLLTIRAKSDKGKASYPCWWFERRASDPHLQLRKGRIIRRKHVGRQLILQTGAASMRLRCQKLRLSTMS